MKVFLVAAARPNFMKIAPIYRASKDCGSPIKEFGDDKGLDALFAKSAGLVIPAGCQPESIKFLSFRQAVSRR